MADSIKAATGTTFSVRQDADGQWCAHDVKAVGGIWTRVARQFEALVGHHSTALLRYVSGGGSQNLGSIDIDTMQVGDDNFRRVFGVFCQREAGGISEPAIIAHELGHAYASMFKPSRTNAIAMQWENRLHRERQEARRVRGCGDHP